MKNDTAQETIVGFAQNLVGTEIRIYGEKIALEGILKGVVATCDNSDINFLVVGEGMKKVSWKDIDVLEEVK